MGPTHTEVYKVKLETVRIELAGRVANGAGLEFLHADAFKQPAWPFAEVWFNEDGQPADRLLRLDTQKRTFLDHFEDPAKEKVASEAAQVLWRLVGDVLYRGAPASLQS